MAWQEGELWLEREARDGLGVAAPNVAGRAAACLGVGEGRTTEEAG